MSELRASEVVYRIEKIAGEGLSAVVYKAIRVDSLGLSRQTVALKVLKSRTAFPELRREFAALSAVSSPYCVRVLAWENIQDRFALVLEWIEGVTLLELARNETLPERLLAEVVDQVHRGLEDLRTCGLHHGDLSPKNILIDQSGAVRIVDFATRPPQNGVVQGTAAYLAPEIWEGDAGGLEADLFALGVIALDARDGFRQIPRDAPMAKTRAFRMATSAPGLLAREPKERKMESVSRSSEEIASAREELGRQVRELLRDREAAAAPTAQLLIESDSGALTGAASAAFPEGSVLPAVSSERGSSSASSPAIAPVLNGQAVQAALVRKSSPVRSLSHGLAQLLMCVALSAPVLAEAPLSPTNQNQANLIISSHRWMEITLNGRKVGYTPVNLSGLRPGTHRLQWRTQSRHGQRSVTLKSGETYRLSEAELLGLRQRGKR